MKPPKFDYHAPRTLEEALALIAARDGSARVLAGGQSLVPMLNFRLAQPAALVDLRLLTQLSGIDAQDGVLRIGAMTRQRAAELSPLVMRQLPLLAAALKWVGHAPTRSRGTVGGSIAHADPSAELPMVLRLLDGEVVAVGPQGARTIPAQALFRSMFTTALAPDEILTEVRLPVMAEGCAFAIEEYARRPGDFAIVAVAVVLEPRAQGGFSTRLVVGGATETVFRPAQAERLLSGGRITAEASAAAAALVAQECTPMSDPRVSGAYRRRLIEVLTRRALEKAAATPGPWRSH